MSSYIFEQVQQAANQTLERLLRPYVPESYNITISRDIDDDYIITLENADGAYMKINMAGEYIHAIFLWNVSSIPGLDKDINDGALALDNIVGNIKGALTLVEQDELDDALETLTQQ